MTEEPPGEPPEDAQVLMVIAWVYRDREDREHPLQALIPSPRGAERIMLWYPFDDPNAEGYDAIARQYARSARVIAYKREYLFHNQVETVDGRPPTP